MQRLIQVDGRVRTDKTYPAGFMDVITIEKTGEFLRLLYDVKGRFVCHRISADEAGYKLCKVNDTVVIDINTGKINEVIKYDTGNTVMVTGGRNTGRVGIITHKEKHASSHDIVHIKDAAGNLFATRLSNIFLI